MLVKSVLALVVLVAAVDTSDARGRGGGRSKSWSSSSTKSHSSKPSKLYRYRSTSPSHTDSDDHRVEEPTQTSSPEETSYFKEPRSNTGMVIDPVNPDRATILAVEPPPVRPEIVGVTVVGRPRSGDDTGHCVSMGAVQCVWDGKLVDHWPVAVGDRATRTSLRWPYTGLPFGREAFTDNERLAIIDQSARAGFALRPTN